MLEAAHELARAVLEKLSPPVEIRRDAELASKTFSTSLRKTTEIITLDDADHGAFASLAHATAVHFELLHESERVRAALIALALKLHDPALVAYFSDTTLRDAELLKVLAHSSSADRVQFISSILSESPQFPEVQGYLRARFDDALQYTSLEERCFLARTLLSAHRSPAPFVMSALLSASASYEELQVTIAAFDERYLKALAEPAINEILALNQIAGIYAKTPPSERLKSDAPLAEIRTALEGLVCEIDRCTAAIEACSDYLSTQNSKDALQCLRSNRSQIDATLASDQSEAELRNFTILMTEKHRIETQCNVFLSSAGDAHWRMEDLSAVRTVLEKIGFQTLHFTPLLHEIQRTSELPPYILGLRHPSGLIQIGDGAIDNFLLMRQYRFCNSLQVTLAHEIGHSIQLGDSPPRFADQSAEIVLVGDPRYSFDEFLKLAGWRVLPPGSFTISEGDQAATIDGKTHALGTPVVINNERVILAVDRGRLYQYSIDGEFSLNAYSRTNPWEDWAEAYCEYLLIPERLKQIAPQKYRYFVDCFGERIP